MIIEVPRVSVIIPHYRDLRGLRRCLEALARQTIPPDDFEVIVADNNSPEGPEKIREVACGRATVIVVKEKGAGPARNGGVAVARGHVLAFIDSDCVAEPEWLAEGLAALPSYDFIGGRVTVLLEEPELVTGAEAFERVFAFDFRTYITRKGFTGAGNLFCTADVFRRVGGFRSGVSEDVEWSLRATAMGLRLGYAPKAIVGHPARRNWSELRGKWQRVSAETYGLYRQRSHGKAKFLLRSLAVPFSAFVHVPKVLFSDQLTGPQQRMSALGMLFKIRFWRLGHALALLSGRGDR